MKFGCINILFFIFLSIPGIAFDIKPLIEIYSPNQTIYCQETVDVPIKLNGANGIISMQGTISWDTSSFSFNRIVNFGNGIQGLGNSNIGLNKVNEGHLIFVWTDNTLNGINLIDSSIIFVLRFNVRSDKYISSVIFPSNIIIPLEFITRDLIEMPVKADSVSIVTKPEIVSFNPFPHEIHTDLLSYLLDAGDGWVTYFWSTGESSRTINVVENGKYSIEVTNTLGCIGKKTVVVNLGPRPDTLYSISNGSWNDPATWHQGFIPIFNSNVVVSHKIIITDDRICRSLLLKNGSDLTIENNKRLSVEYLD